MHSVTGKLNRPANKFDGQNGTTFFVSIGEKHYNFKEKKAGWTNYDAAIFAKDSQVSFYESVLIKGAIIEVSGTSIIVELSDEYGPKLILQDAKLGFAYDGGGQPDPEPSNAPASGMDNGDLDDDPDFDIPF